MLARPDGRIVVGEDGDSLTGAAVFVVDDTEPTIGAVIGLVGDRDAVLDAAAFHAAGLGLEGVRTRTGETRDVVPPADDDLEARFLHAAARAAGRAATAVTLASGGEVKRKADGSVSIAADAAADAAASEGLAELGLPLLSEERPDLPLDHPDDPWMVVDPLDGTGNFLAGLPPWAFSAGLIVGGRATAGFVLDLSSGRRWWGSIGAGAFRDGHPITPRAGGTVVVPTPPSGEAAVVPPGFRRLRITGCTAIDLCLVADGSAGAWHDLDRQGTHVHDVAGALGVLAGTATSVLDPDGAELVLTPDTEGLIRFCVAADEATALGLVDAHR